MYDFCEIKMVEFQFPTKFSHYDFSQMPGVK